MANLTLADLKSLSDSDLDKAAEGGKCSFGDYKAELSRRANGEDEGPTCVWNCNGNPYIRAGSFGVNVTEKQARSLIPFAGPELAKAISDCVGMSAPDKAAAVARQVAKKDERTKKTK